MIYLPVEQNQTYLTLNSKSKRRQSLRIKSLECNVEYESVLYPNQKTVFYFTVYTQNVLERINFTLTVPFNSSFILWIKELRGVLKQISEITPKIWRLQRLYILDNNNSKYHCKEMSHSVELIFKSRIYTKHKAKTVLFYETDTFSFSFNNMEYYNVNAVENMDMDWFKKIATLPGRLRLVNYI